MVSNEQPDCIAALRRMLQAGPVNKMYTAGGNPKSGIPSHCGFSLRMPPAEVENWTMTNDLGELQAKSHAMRVPEAQCCVPDAFHSDCAVCVLLRCVFVVLLPCATSSHAAALSVRSVGLVTLFCVQDLPRAMPSAFGMQQHAPMLQWTHILWVPPNLQLNLTSGLLV